MLLDQHLIPLIIVYSSDDGAASDGEAASSTLAAVYYTVTVGQHYRILSSILLSSNLLRS